MTTRYWKWKRQIATLIALSLICSCLSVIGLPAPRAKAAESMRRVIDNTHPILMVTMPMGHNTDFDPDMRRDVNYRKQDVKQMWTTIPEDIRPYSAVVLHFGSVYNTWNTVEEARKWVEDNLAQGKDLGVPMLLIYGGGRSKATSRGQTDALAWIKTLYENYPNFIGTTSSEQTDADVTAAVPGLVQLAHQYGGYHIHANREDADQFVKTLDNQTTYNTIKANSENFIYTPKNVHINYDYNDSAALGMYLGDLSAGWGPYYDSYNWYATKLMGAPVGSGDITSRMFPESPYEMNMIETAMNGATVFQYENQMDVPAVDSLYSPLFYNAIVPAMRYITTHHIPSKDEMIARTKVAYSAENGTMRTLFDTAGDRTAFFEGLYDVGNDTYSPSGLWYFLRSSGRYNMIPQLPKYTSADVLAKFPNVLTKSSYQSLFPTVKAKIDYFNALYPEISTGDATVNRLDQSWLVYNNNSNENFAQSAYVPLGSDGSFSNIDFLDMSPHTLATVDRKADSLDIGLNNYRTDRKLDLAKNSDGKRILDILDYYNAYAYVPNPQDQALRPTKMRIAASSKPALEISGYDDNNYTYAEQWDEAAHVYTLTVNHNGPVQIRLDTGSGLSDGQGWTTTDGGSADIRYTGAWSQAGGAQDIDGTYAASAAAGNEAEYEFYGTSVQWVGRKSPAGGTADVYIDGVKWASGVRTAAASAQSGQVLFSKTGLSNNLHTIRIVTTDAGETGIDAIRYVRAALQMQKDSSLQDFAFATAEADQDYLEGSEHWMVKNGVMKILPYVAPFWSDIPIYNTKSAYSDFTYEADVNSTAGTPVSITFRTDVNSKQGYSVYLDPTGYNYNGGGTAELKLFKGQYTYVTGANVDLSVNTWYKVKIVAVGSSIKVYLNDTLYIDTTDTSYTSGYTGIRVEHNRGAKNDWVLFDNPKVTVAGSTAYASSFNVQDDAGDWMGEGAIFFPYRTPRTSFDFADRWQSANGSWTVLNDDTIFANGDNGVYSAVADAGKESVSLAGDASWSDYVYNALLRFKSGSKYDAGLLLRVQDSDNLYKLSVKTDGTTGQLQFKKKTAGVWSDLGVAVSKPLALDRWYDLHVEAIGDTLSASLNGTKVLQARDGAYAAGKVGLAVTDGTKAWFDNAWVSRQHLAKLTATPVSNIVVTADGASVTTGGGNLQLSAAVAPASARQDVTWSVTEADGVTPTDKAAIDGSGLLTALKDGTVRVIAAANDGSGARGEYSVTLSGQTGDARIVGFKPVYLSTVKDMQPALPAQATALYSDGTTQLVPVAWPTITASQLSLAVSPYIFDAEGRGKFAVSGTVTGTAAKPVAYVTVTPKLTAPVLGSAVDKVGAADVLNLPRTTYATLTFDAGGGRTFNETSGYYYWNQTVVKGSDMTFGTPYVVEGTVSRWPLPIKMIYNVKDPNANHPATGMLVNTQSLVVAKNKTAKLTATVLPSDADDTRVVWQSADPGIATVAADGTVTGVAAGTTVVTARSVDGGFEARTRITVKDVAITAGGGSISYVAKGSNVQLAASSAYSGSVVWSVVDPTSGAASALATITAAGLLNVTGDAGSFKVVATVGSAGSGEQLIVIDNAGTVLKPTENTSNTITYAAGGGATWSSYSNATRSGGSETYIRPSTSGPYTPAPYAEFTFTGTGIQWVGTRHKTEAIADVYIDGGKAATIDAYGNVSSGIYQSVNFSVEGLVYGSHTIKVVDTGTKNASSTYYSLSIDAFRVVNTGPVKATALALDSVSLELQEGETAQLSATLSPWDVTDRRLQWSSSDEAVATVDGTGLVTAVGGGSAVVKATAMDGSGVTASANIAVNATVHGVTGIALDRTELELVKGETDQLTATLTPSNATNKKVVWSSSDEQIATVDETGLLTAVGGGIATISAVSDDSGDSASAVVTVIERVTGVSLNRTTLDMTVGGTFQLLATVQPAGATNKNVVWQSDNEDAVLVDATGKLTAVGAGSANITVTTADGGLTASTNVTVTTDVVPVAGIALSRTSLALEEGEQATLYATISPDNATHTAVTWQSADEDVATVSAGGVVTAVHAGTTVVTVTTADGGKTATADVVVTAPDIEPVAVTGIALDRSVLALAKGQTGTLTATIAPANATNKQVRWRSSDALVATVDATGLVTAVGGGTATITAESADSGVADTAVVTVTEPVTGVTLNQSTLDMTIGGTYRLLATVLPERATNKQIVWRSDNENAARVDTDGNVTAVGAGTASITATTADGGFETRTLVTVSAAAVSATGVELDMKLLRLVAGNTVRLNATVKPADASNKTIVWSSSAPGVATVDVTGLVQAVAAGTASITATTEDGGFTASATVTVQTAGSPATPAPVPTSTPTPTPTPTSSPTPKPTPTSGSGGTPGSGAPFKDIARLVWAADAIQALSDKGIVKGTGEGVFDPDRSITRADIMVLLFRALKLPTSGAGQGSFADVKPGAYYYDAVTAARQLGIAQGSGGRFDPQAEVTREDLMVLIARSLQAAGFAVKPDGTVDLNDYRDANGLSGYAKDSVRWLAEQGIVQGSGGQLLPKDTATRAEAAVIIYRVLQLIEKKTAE